MLVVTIILLVKDTTLSLSGNLGFVSVSVRAGRLSIAVSTGRNRGLAFRRLARTSSSIVREVSGVGKVGAIKTVTNKSSAVGLVNKKGSDIDVCVLLSRSSGIGTSSIRRGVIDEAGSLSYGMRAGDSSVSCDDCFNDNLSIEVGKGSVSALRGLTGRITSIVGRAGKAISISSNLRSVRPRLAVSISGRGTTRCKCAITRMCRLIDTGVTSDGDTAAVSASVGSCGICIRARRRASAGLSSVERVAFARASGSKGRGRVPLAGVYRVGSAAALDAVGQSTRAHCVAMSYNISRSRGVALLNGGVRGDVSGLGIPRNCRVRVAKRSRAVDSSVDRLILVVVLTIVFVCLVVIMRFRSLISPFVVVFSVPLTFAKKFVTLLLAKRRIGILTVLKFVVLTNLVMGGNVMLVSCVGRTEGTNISGRRTVVSSKGAHIHPVLVAMLAAILTVLAATLKVNSNSSVVHPVTVALVKKLICNAILALVIVPYVCSVFRQRGGVMRRRL